MHLEQQLNPEQLAAVLAPDGPILVLAAAGTGKTRTLVYRVAHLVNRGVAPEHILLLTFTNKASREMLDRARALVGDRVSGVWGGTFHHLANRMLRRYASRLGYGSDFTILDREDSRSLVSQGIKGLGARLPDEFPRAAVLLGIFSAAVNLRVDLGRMLETRYAAVEGDPELVMRVRDAYEARKRAMGAMDFDDLLVNGLRLLQEHEDVAAHYRRQFEHVLVDEYQDTNVIQAELIDRLAAGSRNVLVVGDDFQCIYGWRGADFRNIMTFPERYGDARMFKLETNYRSRPQILAVANACIAGNPEQFQKTLRPTREAGAKPLVARLVDGAEQAAWVVSRMRLMRREGYGWSDMAVLYRAHYHALDVERLLAREGIPYVITSGVRFFEQAHVKDVCAFLRVLVAPADELAFTRLMRLLPGVGERTAARLWEGVGRRFDVGDAAARRRLAALLGKRAKPFWEQVEAALPVVGRGEAALSGAEAAVALGGFIDGFYRAHAGQVFEEPRDRIQDLMALVVDLEEVERLDGYLSDVSLLTNLDSETERQRDDAGQAVRLSTIHQAKGLEWPVVFVLWASEGMFPSARALVEGEGDSDAEERRLFYVAITRAADILHFGSPESRRTREGGMMFCTPSRFLEELPSGLLAMERGGGVQRGIF